MMLLPSCRAKVVGEGLKLCVGDMERGKKTNRKGVMKTGCGKLGSYFQL